MGVGWSEDQWLEKIANLNEQIEMAELLVGGLIEKIKEESGKASVVLHSRFLEKASGNEYMAMEEEHDHGYTIKFSVLGKKGEG